MSGSPGGENHGRAAGDGGNYWDETRRPLACLLFVIPGLLAYECGLAFAGPQGEAFRNGADVWLRSTLMACGFATTWWLPLAMIGTLLAWHVLSDQRWHVARDTLAGMTAESLLFAFVLILFGQAADATVRSALVSWDGAAGAEIGGSPPAGHAITPQLSPSHAPQTLNAEHFAWFVETHPAREHQPNPRSLDFAERSERLRSAPLPECSPGPTLSWSGEDRSAVTWLWRAVSFLGAGIYEEFVFRLGLIPLAYLILRLLLVPKQTALVGAIVASSSLFALAHYLPPDAALGSLAALGEAATTVQTRPELWFGCLFRGLAGVFFGVLFWQRGLGITIGCHAVYDVVVGVILLPAR